MKLDSKIQLIQQETENYTKLYQQEVQTREAIEKEHKGKIEDIARLEMELQKAKLEMQRLDKLLTAPKLPSSLIQSSRVSAINNTKLSEHVAKVSKKTFNDTTTLAKELIWAASSDLDKAWLIFLWISQNIAYITTDEIEESKFRFNSSKILKEKKGYCLDYCYLYAELAKEIGLDSRVVTGYAKSGGFEPGVDRFGDPNHHWNTVLLNGSWYLMDVMWGSGVVNAQNKFEFKLRDFYFLTPPDQFLNNHYPQEKRWQLVDNTISLREYELRTLFYEPYFTNKLDLIAPLESIVVLDKDPKMQILLNSEEPVSLIAEVETRTGKVPNSTLVSRKTQNEYILEAECPSKGVYSVNVYCKKKGEEKNYQCCFKIKVECGAGSETGKSGFPTAHAAYGENCCVLMEPKTRFLRLGKKVNFCVEAPGADSLAVIIDKKWNYLQKEVGSFLFRGAVDITGKDVSLFGKFNGGANYDSILVYEAY